MFPSNVCDVGTLYDYWFKGAVRDSGESMSLFKVDRRTNTRLYSSAFRQKLRPSNSRNSWIPPCPAIDWNTPTFAE